MSLVKLIPLAVFKTVPSYFQQNPRPFPKPSGTKIKEKSGKISIWLVYFDIPNEYAGRYVYIEKKPHNTK
jgi:hypothetical protein